MPARKLRSSISHLAALGASLLYCGTIGAIALFAEESPSTNSTAYTTAAQQLAPSYLASLQDPRFVEARAAIKNQNAPGAEVAYKSIPWGDPLYAERLIDAMRWQISQNKTDAAWQIYQLSIRLGLSLPEQDYWRAYLQSRSGNCDAKYLGSEEAHAKLLLAHAYRFAPRFLPRSYESDPYEMAEMGVRQQHLYGSTAPFLQDLSRLRLIKQRSCGILNLKSKQASDLRFAEFRSLRAWWRQTLPDQERHKLAGWELVKLRLLFLAQIHEDSPTSAAILQSFRFEDFARLHGLRDQERRFLLQAFLAQEASTKVPFAWPAAEAKHVRSYLLAHDLAEEQVNRWLGLLDLDDGDVNERHQFLQALAAKSQLQKHVHLQWLLTEASYEKGDLLGCVAGLRRLLLTDANRLPTALEKAAMALALEFFREFRHDKTLSGALQNAIPARRWRSIYEQMMIEHALHGEKDGFQAITKLASQLKAGAHGQFEQDYRPLLEHLLSRDLRAFVQGMQKLSGRKSGFAGRQQRMSVKTLQFLASLGSAWLKMPPQQQSSLQAFASAITSFLQENLNSGQQQKEVSELMLLFAPDAGAAWVQGANAAREGHVAVGSVNIGGREAVPLPFAWEGADDPGLRDLIPEPGPFDERSWVLK